MAEGRGRSDWSRTAALMALTANCHRDPKKGRAFKPADFDPYAQSGRREIGDMAELKDWFTRGRARYGPRAADRHGDGNPKSDPVRSAPS